MESAFDSNTDWIYVGNHTNSLANDIVAGDVIDIDLDSQNNISLIKNGVPITSQTTPTFSVVVTSTIGGTVNSEGGVYEEGTGLHFQATADAFYRFTHWIVGPAGGHRQNQQLFHVVSGNVTHTAVFERIPQNYQATFVASGPGRIVNTTTGINPSKMYLEETSVEVRALPNSGATFVDWNDGITDATRTITISDNVTYTANFSYGNDCNCDPVYTNGAVSVTPGSDFIWNSPNNIVFSSIGIEGSVDDPGNEVYAQSRRNTGFFATVGYNLYDRVGNYIPEGTYTRETSLLEQSISGDGSCPCVPIGLTSVEYIIGDNGEVLSITPTTAEDFIGSLHISTDVGDVEGFRLTNTSGSQSTLDISSFLPTRFGIIIRFTDGNLTKSLTGTAEELRDGLTFTNLPYGNYSMSVHSANGTITLGFDGTSNILLDNNLEKQTFNSGNKSSNSFLITLDSDDIDSADLQYNLQRACGNCHTTQISLEYDNTIGLWYTIGNTRSGGYYGLSTSNYYSPRYLQSSGRSSADIFP